MSSTTPTAGTSLTTLRTPSARPPSGSGTSSAPPAGWDGGRGRSGSTRATAGWRESAGRSTSTCSRGTPRPGPRSAAPRDPEAGAQEQRGGAEREAGPEARRLETELGGGGPWSGHDPQASGVHGHGPQEAPAGLGRPPLRPGDRAGDQLPAVGREFQPQAAPPALPADGIRVPGALGRLPVGHGEHDPAGIF